MYQRLIWAMLLGSTAFASNVSQAASARTFVSTTGVDTNISANCGLTSPCRTFAAALSVTASGGEVVVLNSGGYGPPFTITQSVSIIAPNGIYAGVTVPGTSSAGITINATGADITLRGLAVMNQGVSGSGINVVAGNSVTVTACDIENFYYGILDVGTSTLVTVRQTVLRRNMYGIWLQDGPTGVVTDTTLDNNSLSGAFLWHRLGSGATTALVSNSTCMGGSSCPFAMADVAGGTAKLTVTHSTVVNASNGVTSQSNATGALSEVFVDSSTIANSSSVGLFSVGPSIATLSAQSSGTIVSDQNRIVGNNGGAITAGGTISLLGNNSFLSNVNNFCGETNSGALCGGNPSGIASFLSVAGSSVY
jgi:hypothetical protein